MSYFVYLLECADKTIYTGITTDVARRFAEHKNKSGSHYTASHDARKIIYTEECASRSEALKREAEIVNPPPSKAWVFIDEHERSINDGWFAVDMVGKKGLLDAPATRHGDSYALSFADGQAEIWKLLDPRTRNWTKLPISNNPLNPDWQRLQAATTSLKPVTQ